MVSVASQLAQRRTRLRERTRDGIDVRKHRSERIPSWGEVIGRDELGWNGNSHVACGVLDVCVY